MTPIDTQIPAAYIKECFDSDADGNLYWKARPRDHFSTRSGFSSESAKAGQRAGRMKSGYWNVTLSYQRRRYTLLVHRIIWLLHTGSWPEFVVDHINRDRTHNRICNLREATPDENLRNNGNPHGTGLLGAYPSKGRFQSFLQKPYPYRSLGTFDTALQAHEAYVAAVAEFNPALAARALADKPAASSESSVSVPKEQQ